MIAVLKRYICFVANQYRTITIDDIKELAKSRSLKLLSSIYINARTKLRFSCERCGNSYETTYISLNRTKFGCIKCSKILGIRKGGRKPFKSRPNSKLDWKYLLKENNLSLIEEGESLPDKSGRKYKTISYRCSNKFGIDGKPHPIMISRITNIERNLKHKQPIICKYCEWPNYIAPKGYENHKADMIRLEKSLTEKVKKMYARLIPNQTFETSRKKFDIEHVSGIVKRLNGRDILDKKIENPFTRGERLSEQFTTKYCDVLKICKEKSFKILINEDEYNELIKYDESYKLSPSTRTIKFEYLGEINEAPIVTIMKKGWLPKFNNIKEEICRCIIEKLLQNKFPNTRPKTLIGVMGVRLELDGYNNNINGYKVAFEHQGKQHYTLEFNGKKLINQKENDNFKKQWCKQNDVILIEIPDIGTKTTSDSTRLDDIPKLVMQTLESYGFPTSKINSKKINDKEIYNYVKHRLEPRLNELKNRYVEMDLLIINETLKGTSYMVSVKDKFGKIIYKNKGISTLENLSDKELSFISKSKH